MKARPVVKVKGPDCFQCPLSVELWAACLALVSRAGVDALPGRGEGEWCPISPDGLLIVHEDDDR